LLLHTNFLLLRKLFLSSALLIMFFKFEVTTLRASFGK
jgi:hypothetical protein